MSTRDRLEARADRRENWATKAAAASDAALTAANRATEGIPLGQPILSGHHSEGMHRAAIRRSAMTDHTPGPWYAVGANIYAKSLPTLPPIVKVSAVRGYVELDANTTLITAAPDLLAALQELCTVPNKHRPDSVWDAARAAIAKATEVKP